MKLNEVPTGASALGMLTALVDGCGEATEIGLYFEQTPEDDPVDIEWPSDWPSIVSFEFLRAQGFQVRHA